MVAELGLAIAELGPVTVALGILFGSTRDQDRDSSHRALLREGILGVVAVILLSLAVPAWKIQVEYSKTFGAAAGRAPVSAAEVLRERTTDTGSIPMRASAILKLAEQVVRREAERYETERRERERRKAQRELENRVESREADGRAVEAPSAPSDQRSDFRPSIQAP